MANTTLHPEMNTMMHTTTCAPEVAAEEPSIVESNVETRSLDLARMYELYLPLVQRICYRYTKNQEEAGDLAQEVFLKVHASWRGFEGNSQPSTWLYRVAVNHCLDHIRWKKRQGDLMTAYAEDLAQRPPQTPSSSHPAKRLLRRLLEDMDEANRQVVFLRFEVGLTHEEIAEICGVSRVAVTKRLAKFQNRLASLKGELMDSMQDAGFQGTATRVTAHACGEQVLEEA